MRERAERSRLPRISTKTVMGWLLTGTFAAYAVPAHADWQYTKWGMSPSEVIEASGGKAKVNEKPTKAANGDLDRLTGHYSAGDYSFVALFRFNQTDKLIAVQLLLEGASKCGSLRDELIAKYGSPTRVITSSLSNEAAWLVPAENTKLHLMDLGPGTLCSLEYSGFSSASRNGL